jgi:hypothetical protein
LKQQSSKKCLFKLLGNNVEDSDDDSSSEEDDEDDDINLEGELEGEAEEVDIVFDDPQERHAGSLRVLLRQSSLCAALGQSGSMNDARSPAPTAPTPAAP